MNHNRSMEDKPAMKDVSLRCPVCASEDTKSVPIVYKSGVSNIDASMVGIGVGAGGGLGIGGASTTGTSATLLAEELAPPRKISLVKWGAILGFITLFLTNMARGWEILIVFVLAVGFSFWLLRRFHEINQRLYPPRLREWERSFVCLRCGHVFTSAHESAIRKEL